MELCDGFQVFDRNNSGPLDARFFPGIRVAALPRPGRVPHPVFRDRVEQIGDVFFHGTLKFREKKRIAGLYEIDGLGFVGAPFAGVEADARIDEGGKLVLHAQAVMIFKGVVQSEIAVEFVGLHAVIGTQKPFRGLQEKIMFGGVRITVPAKMGEITGEFGCGVSPVGINRRT